MQVIIYGLIANTNMCGIAYFHAANAFIVIWLQEADSVHQSFPLYTACRSQKTSELVQALGLLFNVSCVCIDLCKSTR